MLQSTASASSVIRSSIVTPYVCSTPLSTYNDRSLSFSDLSLIDDIEQLSITARKRKRSVSSPDLSDRITLANQLTPLFTNSNSDVCSNGNRSTCDSIFGDFNIPEASLTGVKKKYKNIRKGQDWSMFKPRRKDGIYNSLIQNQDYKEEVHNWMQHLKDDHRSATISMIQFLIDICGYQELVVASIWKSKEYNLLQLISHMEENPPKLQIDTGKYLFKFNISDWARYIQNLIYNFIQYFLEVVYEDFAFENVVLVMALVINFASSKNRSMRHTGLVIIMKWNTVILNIHTKSNLNKSSDIVVDLFQKFSIIIENNCDIQDLQLDLMKIVCIEEMFLWFCVDPALMCDSKMFNRLMRFVQNQSKGVREAALKSCYKLITTEHLSKHLKPLIEIFSKVVGGRVCDVDYKIAVSAVKICTIILEKFEDAIEDIIRNKIVYMIFAKNALLAAAAGEFFIKYINAGSEDYFLVKLVCYVHTIKKVDSIMLMVEATLDSCPALSAWDLMINLLLNEHLECNPELQTILICIMSESVQQSFHGKSKICRMQSYDRRPKVTSSEITAIFVNKMPQLLKKYKTNILGLKMLLEILSIMNIEEVAASKDAIEIDNILSSLRPIFAEQTDKGVLELISKYLSVMCGNNVSLINRYQSKIETLKLATRNAISNFIKELNKEEVETWLLRALLLITHHDLKEIMTFQFFMETVEFVEKNNFTPNAIEHALKCCYQSLKWHLKFIIDNAIDNASPESLNEDIAATKNAFDNYTHCCFMIMTETQEVNLRIVAFECICEVYAKFKHDLDRPSNINNALSALIPDMENPIYVQQLMNHAHVILFERTTKESLSSRRILLGKTFDLIHLNVIEFTESTKLYQYYYSHHDDYGDIFESALKNIEEISVLAYTVIILQSLIYRYSQYLLSTDKNEPTEEALSDLQKLGKQFQLLMNRSVSNSQKLLSLGIQYASSSERHYMFFDIIKVFSKPLSLKEKQTLIKLVMDKIPKANKNNEYVKTFVWFLQNRNISRRVVHTDANSTSATETSVKSNENYNISDSSIIS